MKIRNIVIFVLFILSLYSCSSNREKSVDKNTISQTDRYDFDHKVIVNYAKGFSVYNGNGYKKITLLNPNNNLDTIASYIVYPQGDSIDSSIMLNSISIAVPIKNVACMSTTTVGMMPLLNLDNKIVGIANSDYVYNQNIRSRIDSGYIENIGSGMGKNVEKILMLHPSVLTQGLSNSDDKDNELINYGIPVVFINNWKERTVLGRAEWIKIMGILFCKNAKADSVFNDITNEYTKTLNLVSNINSDSIRVIWGQSYQGSWYVPSKNSYVTSLLKDAGCYFESTNSTNTSVPYSLEAIFSRHRNDSIWLYQAPPNIKSIKSLVENNPRYKDFLAVSKGKVFSDRKRVNGMGGNDIWESGIYRPDLLLKDIVKISHPKLLDGYELTYWYRLK